MNSKFTVGLYEVIGKPLVVGHGTVWPISGYIDGPCDDIVSLHLLLNDKACLPETCFRVPFMVSDVDYFGEPLLPDRLHFSHFVIAKPDDSSLSVAVRIRHKQGEVTLPLHTQNLLENFPEPIKNLPPARVAICMTTFNPKVELFERQINSIINQQEKSWQLIINDDCSDEASYRIIQQIAKKDARIHVYQNTENLGFYYNFETVLSYVGNQFEYVALSDQDDIWYPQKLSRLLDKIGSAQLIYNDMSIKTPEDSTISETFWDRRSNHFKSQSTLMIANTVSGSAALFRQSLIKKILPFPARLGNAFHDHWLALIASIDHKLSYCSEALQAYIQHRSNVTGHGRFREVKMHESTLSLLSLQRMKMSLSLYPNEAAHSEFLQNNVKVYFDAYMRRKLAYKILELRFPHWHNKRLEKIFRSNKKSISQLLKLHLHIYSKGWKTNNAELSYINAIEVLHMLQFQQKT